MALCLLKILSYKIKKRYLLTELHLEKKIFKSTKIKSLMLADKLYLNNKEFLNLWMIELNMNKSFELQKWKIKVLKKYWWILNNKINNFAKEITNFHLKNIPNNHNKKKFPNKFNKELDWLKM